MKKTPRRYARLPSIACPHCSGRCKVRDSQEVTKLVRELRLTCNNDDCGHTFVAQLSVIRTIRPAAEPNPEIHLPFGAWSPSPANENHREPANDDSQSEKASLVAAAIAGAMST